MTGLEEFALTIRSRLISIARYKILRLMHNVSSKAVNSTYLYLRSRFFDPTPRIRDMWRSRYNDVDFYQYQNKKEAIIGQSVSQSVSHAFLPNGKERVTSLKQSICT